MPQFDKKYQENAILQKGFNAQLITQIIDYILRVLPQAKTHPIRILDLCCGDGGVTNSLANALEDAGIQIEQIIGYDISTEQIDVAKQYDDGSKRLFKVQDIATISEENEYDVIISLFGLHWLADINDVAGRIHKTLKPEGKLFFFVPLEKETLFAFRKSLVYSPKWQSSFEDFQLHPFHYHAEVYRDAFIPFFQDENPEPISGTQHVDFHADQFKQFLSSWMPELRHLPEDKRQSYLDDLFDLFPAKETTACPDVEKNSDKGISFYERIAFFTGEKKKESDDNKTHTINSSCLHL